MPMLSRRNFLRYVAYAAPLAAAAPAVARTIFLPPPKRLIKCDEYFASVNSWYLKTTYDEGTGLKRVLRTNEGVFDLAPIKAEGSIIAYDGGDLCEASLERICQAAVRIARPTIKPTHFVFPFKERSWPD